MLCPVQNAVVDDVVAGSAVVNEFSLGCRIARLTTVGTGGFALGNGLGERIHLCDSLRMRHGNDAIRFVQGSLFSNVRLIRNPLANVVPFYDGMT